MLLDKKNVFGISSRLLLAAAVPLPRLFVTSDRCQACHNGLISPQGEDVSIGSGWRSSMMANASRDPYWQAAVRRETLVHPTASEAIQNECSACHMPIIEGEMPITGNDNDADRDRYEPHYQEIDSPDKVQIYEDIMAGPGGEVTTVLLTATQYLKDNRLLPEGFNKRTAPGDVAVHGAAEPDADFLGGKDIIFYSLIVGRSNGPFLVQAELWYKPIGYRWAHNLAQEESFETDRFVRYFKDMADSSAILLASVQAKAEKPLSD
jgi:hypothetical protein